MSFSSLVRLCIPGLLFCAQSVFGATYYVSPSGSDSASGSSSAPLQTLAAGVSKAQAGDTIIVKDGVYSGTATINKSGTASAWITIRAENKHKAIFDCNKSCHSIINLANGSAYWVIEGLQMRNTKNMGVISNSSGGKNIVIRGNYIHHIGNVTDNTNIGIVGIYTNESANNFIIEGNIIHDVGRTNRYTNSYDHGVYLHGQNMIIRNNVFFNALNGWHVQTASGFSGQILNNTLYGPNLFGKNGQIILWDVNGDVVIRNNIFYNPQGVAITTYEPNISGTCAVTNNIVYHSSTNVGLAEGLPSKCTQANNQLNVNPMLVTPSIPSFDFHLKAGSPAIGAGYNLGSSVALDFDGKSRMSWDIGAFAYGGTAPAPTPAPSTPAPAPSPMPAPSTSTGSAQILVSGDPATGSYSVTVTTNRTEDIRVEFYDNGVLVATERAAPYCLTPELKNGTCGAGKLGLGTHNLVAKVFPENGTTLLAQASRTIVEGSAAPSNPAPAAVSVANGGFEQQLSGWSVSGTVALVASPRSGSSAAAVSPGGSLSQNLASQLVSGRRYKLTVYARVEAAGDAGSVALELANSSGPMMLSNVQVTATSYQAVVIEFLMPSGATQANVRAVKSSGSSRLLVDDFSIVQIP